MFKNYLCKITNNFGFDGSNDFFNSFIHNKYLMLTIPLASISSIFENIFGLQAITIMSFMVLLILELVTGITSSKIRGEKIVSHKFGRFGFKVFVWLCLLFITNSLRLEYQNSEEYIDKVGSTLFTWLHGTLFIYIVLEYLISVLENINTITGKSNNPLITSIINKLTSFLGNNNKN